MQKSSTTLLMNYEIYVIHMIGVHCYSKVYLYTYVDGYMNVFFMYKYGHL